IMLLNNSSSVVSKNFPVLSVGVCIFDVCMMVINALIIPFLTNHFLWKKDGSEVIRQQSRESRYRDTRSPLHCRQCEWRHDSWLGIVERAGSAPRQDGS